MMRARRARVGLAAACMVAASTVHGSAGAEVDAGAAARAPTPSLSECRRGPVATDRRSACGDALFYHAMNDLMPSLRFHEAEELLKKTIALSPTPRVGAHAALAEAYERQGKLLLSLTEWGTALTLAGSRGGGEDDVLRYVKRERQRVWDQLARTKLTSLHALPPGTSLRVRALPRSDSVPAPHSLRPVDGLPSAVALRTDALVPQPGRPPLPIDQTRTIPIVLARSWPEGLRLPEASPSRRNAPPSVRVLADSHTYLLLPGPHEVLLTAPMHKPRVYEVTLSAGDENLTLEPLELEERWKSPPPPTWYFASQQALGWTLLGTGAATLLASTVFGVQWLGQYSELRAKGQLHPESNALYTRMNTTETWSLALLGAGLAFGGAGALLLLVRPPAADIMAPAIEPRVGTHYAGVSWSGSF